MVPLPRAKHWCFTLNNYTDDDVERIKGLVESGLGYSYICFGKERGEDNETPHLQGFLSLETKANINRLKTEVSDRAHFEIARAIQASIAYCEKDGEFTERGVRPRGRGSRSDLEAFKNDVKNGMFDMREIREKHSAVYSRCFRFVIEYIADHRQNRDIANHELFNWQKDVLHFIDQEPDDRTICFVVDVEGNNGKTWFSHWVSSQREYVQVIQPAKKVDMAYALDSTTRILFVDTPRSKQGEYVQYDFLEDCKNGYVFSTKYESRVKQLSKMHVIVLMNEMPDMTKLSHDRYKIFEL
jgi:hypothetical protein